MRIIAGAYRGTRLAAVGKGDAGAHLRPTPDRVRESLFNVLAGRIDFEDAQVLDLFAGTGALGFEALSRGAAHVTFVDTGRVAHRLITENIRKLNCADQCTLLRCDARRLPDAQTGCDLVFLDPPYGKDMGAQALVAARAAGRVATGALVVWEDSAPHDAPDGFAPVQQRAYGSTHLTLLQAAE